MESTLPTKKLIVSQKPIKRTSISPDDVLFSPRYKKLTRSIDETLMKIYGHHEQNPLKRLSTKKLKNNKACYLKNKEKAEARFNSTLPYIYPEKRNHSSRAKLTLTEKEDHLDNLISNFVHVNAPKPRITRFREELQKSIDKGLDSDTRLYDHNLQSFRGKEMVEYQKNLQKNLRIEKLRKQNQKRIKIKLRSL